MKEEKKIVIEAYRLKQPNTGLYHFTKELGRVILNENPQLDISFFTTRKGGEVIGNNAKVIPIRPYHSILPCCPSGTVDIWHSTYQLSKFAPPRGVKNLLTLHDLNFLYEKSEKKRARYLKALQKCVSRADHIVAISEYSKQDLLRHIDIGTRPIDVIYNGCNIYQGVRTPPATQPGTPFLFGIGVIQRKKNWHVLPAILKGNEYKLCIAGRLSSYAEEIMTEAKRYGVQDRVFLLGEVSEAEKHWYLQNCEAFVFPSIAEGFGLPVLEAMYYGKPVFLSRHTSLPEVGGEYAYYFNYEFEPEAMQREFAEGMEHFSKEGDPQAEKEYAKSFSWQRAARQYIELYHKLSK